MDVDDGSSSGQTPSAANPKSNSSTPQGAATTGTGSGSASASGASGAPSGGKPTPTSGSLSHAAPAASNPQLSERRRGLGVVTPNACTECRKKRAKCDGQKPCSRCKAQKDVECVYEVPVRQSKENLRTEIESLRSRQQANDQVLAALVKPDTWEEVLGRLRNGQSTETISDWLGGVLPSGGGALPSISAIHADQKTSAGPILPPLSSFRPLGQGGIGSLGPGLSPISAPQSSLRHGVGPSSHWDYTSQSHSGSNRSGSHPDAMNWTADVQGSPQLRVGSWAKSNRPEQASDGLPRFRGLEQILSPLNEPEMKSPSNTWTSITGDVNLVQHLLALYFCWEYPTFASLSKEHFLRDYQDGVHRYCSPVLVNALLALGCRFSTQPKTREYPNDPYSSGDHFFKESQRLFYEETDHHSLTTIQALGIMSIREASCGRDSESWYYAGQSIRLAIEMGLHQIQAESNDELAVRSATFWGAFALDHAWSLATGSLPQCSCFPTLPSKPTIIGDVEASLWVPYTDDGSFDAPSSPEREAEMLTDVLPPSTGAPLQRSYEQPSNVRSVYKCFCELSELVHQSLYILHSPGRPLTARDLLSIYTQYLNWYARIPEVLRLGHNFTPAVLFAHMYYHFAILLLFRPLIKLRIIGSKVYPRDVCLQAADAIQGLLKSYSQLYTLRRTPSFVPYFLLTASSTHLAIAASSLQPGGANPTPDKMEKAARLDPRVSDAIAQGIAYLSEMAPCHQFAEQALNILRYLAKKWKIDADLYKDKPVPENLDKLVQPNTHSLNFFVPNVQTEDFLCEWSPGSKPGKITEGDGDATTITTDEEKPTIQETAEGMENPLFWPFPMQGRPILLSGKALEKAGFAILREHHGRAEERGGNS